MPSSVVRPLSKVLTAPSKVAHALDWSLRAGGSVLSMSILKDRIELAVASHPSTNDPVQSLPSLPLKTEIVGNRRVLSPEVTQELSETIQDWQVCGMVVNWPVQKEGWCGAPCGRVLFTLDQLTANKALNRPICLWDEVHHAIPYEDEWGRSPVYAEASDKTVHFASKEQYEPPTTVVADVWSDFCRAHWPEFYRYNSHHHGRGRSSSLGSWSSTSSSSVSSTSRNTKPWLSSTTTSKSPPSPPSTELNPVWLETNDMEQTRAAAL